MLCRVLLIALGWIVVGSSSFGQEILRGTLKKLDLEAMTATIEVDGKSQDYLLTDATRVLDATGDTLAERLKGFTPGTMIFLRPESRDGKQVLTGLKLAAADGDSRPAGRSEGQIQQGKVKAIEAESRQLTIVVGEKEVVAQVTDRTEFRNIAGNTLAERLAALKPEQNVAFVVRQEGGRNLLVGIMRGEGRNSGRSGERVSPDHTTFKPLTELGMDQYHGYRGGLYPDGKNTRPEGHEQAGLQLARQVRPLNSAGQPDENGKVVLLSIGMSNTSQISTGLQAWLREHAAEVHPRLQFINGAQGGMTAESIQNPDDGGRGTRFWNEVDQRLAQGGVTRAQVQAVWIKQADGNPSQGFPGYAKKLQAELQRIVQVIAQRFPQCRLAYLSSRTYGGYATTMLNPEPVAYESGFAVKWLIEEQLQGNTALNYDSSRGPVKAPWLSWGPYLWANGATPRADGFRYEPSDFSGDGTHHATEGQRKTGALLGEFLLRDTTSRGWFAKP